MVLDTTWTPDPTAGPEAATVSIRQVVGRVLERLDPNEEASRLLDTWAAESGVVPALTIGETSFWYYARLRHWSWLQERLIWAHVLRRLLDDHCPVELVCSPGCDPSLIEVSTLMAGADGISLRIEPGLPPGRTRPGWRRLLGRLRRLAAGARARGSRVRRLVRPSSPTDPLDRQLERLAREPEGRLLVVLTQAPHRVDTATGPRVVNPYLGPVADRLAGTRLDPIILDRNRRRSGVIEAVPEADHGPGRILPADAIRTREVPSDRAAEEQARQSARAIALVRRPVGVAGIDLGGALAGEVAGFAAGWFPRKHVEIARLGRLLERLPIAGILVADEYHRQECYEAARLAGIPVFAVQHGTIYRRHNGYIHADRPPQLRLPARTYVFGEWERELLVGDSVYREDEVVVAGSPRLDLFDPGAVDRHAVRSECGVATGDRMIVVSGTYGGIYRRFTYPLLLARLFDRPLPRVHVVVKQHPAEPDEGPYRAVIEGVAAAGGFAPPPVTIVQHVDLYRLLSAADAHLGIHSTVLTEAVFVGTPNLLATGVLGGDLLDYVAAGVALPVATGAELLAALDSAASAITPEARAAFIRRHFEPGSASDRIAADMLATIAAREQRPRPS